MEDKLKYATEREKEAYKLRQEGKTYKINFDREACKSKFPYEYFLMNDALKNITETLDLPTYLYNIR